ncbi:hypothetical protein P0D75_43850 [Paraburkholderia sediminicola]|uniref:hypothetical protein n=1 Tax=Paraburkholderia sediminicola TaxID=458836 RepID=UPI00105E520C
MGKYSEQFKKFLTETVTEPNSNSASNRAFFVAEVWWPLVVVRAARSPLSGQASALLRLHRTYANRLEQTSGSPDMLRALTENEHAFIAEVARNLAPNEGAQLLSDLAIAQAQPILPDESIIRFHLKGYYHPTSGGQELYPFEGVMSDLDDTNLDVLLLTDAAGRLYEMEFVRWEGGDLQGPDWTTLRIVPKSPPFQKR